MFIEKIINFFVEIGQNCTLHPSLENLFPQSSFFISNSNSNHLKNQHTLFAADLELR